MTGQQSHHNTHLILAKDKDGVQKDLQAHMQMNCDIGRWEAVELQSCMCDMYTLGVTDI